MNRNACTLSALRYRLLNILYDHLRPGVFKKFTFGVRPKRFSAASVAPCADRTDIRWQCNSADFLAPSVPGRSGTCSDLRPGRCTRSCVGRRPVLGG